MLGCVSFVQIERETAGAACIRRSLRPLIGEGGSEKQNSGERSREIAKLCLQTLTCHPPRKRVIQYSRDVIDWIARPRRTGCPAFAGHDGFRRPPFAYA